MVKSYPKEAEIIWEKILSGKRIISNREARELIEITTNLRKESE